MLRELRPCVNQLNLLTAMLDQFALSVLMNLPELAEAQKPQAIAAGRRRHQGWREAVAELLQENLPQSAAAGVESELAAADPGTAARRIIARQLGAQLLAAIADPAITDILINEDGRVWY